MFTAKINSTYTRYGIRTRYMGGGPKQVRRQRDVVRYYSEASIQSN